MAAYHRLPYAAALMPTSQKLRPFPGLLAGALPLLLTPISFIMFASLDAEHSLDIFKGPGGLFWVSAACTLVLMFVLYYLAAGSEVPLLLPVTLALVPWLVAVRHALGLVTKALEYMDVIGAGGHFSHLLHYTDRLLWLQLLGAWISVTLLLACVGGLVIKRLDSPYSQRKGDTSGVNRRLFEAVIVLLLAVGVLTCISEALGLTQIIKAFQGSSLYGLEGGLKKGARELRALASLYPWVLGALLLGMGALGAQRLMVRPRNVAGLAGLGAMALLVAGTFWVHGLPLARMEQQIASFMQPRPALAGLPLLPWGATGPSSALEVVVTPQELHGPGDTQVAWSEGDKALVDFLLRAYDRVGMFRPRSNYSNAIGAMDSRTLVLALDERLTTRQLRQLIDASTEAGLHAFTLLAKRDLDARGDVSFQLRAVSSEHPFLQQLGAIIDPLPGSITVYLPPAFQGNRLTDRIWVGEVGAGSEVHLSPWNGSREQKPVVLALSGPEKPPSSRIPVSPVLFLHVREEAALIDVAHAVRLARARGFSLVLTTAPPPAGLPEESSGSRQP